MIDEEVARDGMLLKTPDSAAAATVWAATLTTLSSDLEALGAAAFVLARHGAVPVLD
jgi:hypothetical protein